MCSCDVGGRERVQAVRSGALVWWGDVYVRMFVGELARACGSGST
jgi:hypothetical protein